MPFALTDVSFLQAVLIVTTAFFASIIGGLAGYGTGLLLPLVLVPIVGAQAAVPVMALAALFTNTSRAIAFRTQIHWHSVATALPLAIIATIAAATLFTSLNQRGAAIVVGSVLMALVPLRHILQKVGYQLNTPGLAAGGGLYGFVTGTSTGAGVILVSILMAAGLSGTAVVATDAAISIAIGLAKVFTFTSLGALPLPLLIFGILVGVSTIPGAFVAKKLAGKITATAHNWLLDVAVLVGGAVMMLRAL